jgi:MFS family permease
VPAGNLLSAGVLWVMNFALSDAAFLSWGWRVPFLLSGVLLLVGLWIRVAVTESPQFEAMRSEEGTAKVPLLEVLRTHPRGLLTAMAARIGTDVAFYVFTLYLLTYITTNVGLPRQAGLTAVLVGSGVQLVLIPFFGALSDRVGRRPVYAAGAVAAAVWAFALFPLLDTGNRLVIVLAVVVALVTHAAMYGPQAAFVAEMFPTRLRYSGASMGYQVAGILGGALAPIIAVRLVQTTGSTLAVSVYVLLALAITGVALWFAPETASVRKHPVELTNAR